LIFSCGDMKIASGFRNNLSFHQFFSLSIGIYNPL
jgi:hypothetical protein